MKQQTVFNGNVSEALRIIQGVAGLTNAQMTELMGYRDRTSYHNILTGKSSPRSEIVFEAFIKAGINPDFFFDLSAPLLRKGVTIPQFREAIAL